MIEAPPSTQSKLTITDASRTSLDIMIDEVMAEFKGSLLTKEQLLLQVQRYTLRVSVSSELPAYWQERIPGIFKRATIPVNCKRIMIDGMERTVRAIGAYDNSIINDPEKILAEVMKDGPLTFAPDKPSAETGKVLELVAGAQRR